MKKLLMALLMVFILYGSSFATEYVFTPPDPDLYDLNHYDYYSWVISWTPPTLDISDVQITFHNIYNSDTSSNWLYVHLLDPVSGDKALSGSPFAGNTSTNSAYQFTDADNNIDNWAGHGVALPTWSDTDGPATVDNVTYSLKDLGLLSVFTEYLANGNNFALGIDPDCHFVNDGITLRIITPEPGTLLLLGLGLTGFAFLARRRAKKQRIQN